VFESAYLKDPSNALTAEQVRTAPFQAYQGSLAMGFVPGAVWVRLTLNPVEAEPDGRATEAVLRVSPSQLERVDLFVQTNGHWTQQTRGALSATAAQGSPDSMHSFDVKLPTTEPTQVFLRMDNNGFLVTQVGLFTRAELLQVLAERVRYTTASVVLSLCLLGLGLVFLIYNRSLLLLVYCGFQLTVVLFVASHLGLLGLSLPSLSPEVLVKFNRLVYVLRVGATVLLAWALLQPHRLAPLYLRGIQVMLGLCALSALLSLTENVRLAYRLSFVVFSVIPVWQLYGIWTAAQLTVQQRRIHTTGCGVYLVVLTLGLWLTLTDSSWLPDTGPVKQMTDFRLNGMFIGVFFFWITILEHMAQKKNTCPRAGDAAPPGHASAHAAD